MNTHSANKKIPLKTAKSNRYDVIIIGAGMGGLTCGCYLAKAGMKVLIVEQHHKVGGYCTSFRREGFSFDATTHYMGSFRENGILRKIYEELGLDSKVEIVQMDPTNVVVCPDYRIYVRSDINETISSFQNIFRKEAGGIADFFQFVLESDLSTLYARLRNKTFKQLLEEYFEDEEIHSVLGVFLGNIGVAPSRASALSSVILFREFVLDGGYYPKGGMQKFSNAFAEKFKEWGGEIINNVKVEKIVVENQKITGIITGNNDFIESPYVVSNGDARETFLNMIGEDYLSSEFLTKINSLEISPSAFIVYLGLNKSYSEILKDRCSWWCYLNREFDAERLFSDLERKDRPFSDDFVFCVFTSANDPSLAPPNKETVYLVVPAKNHDPNYWHKNRHKISDDLIRRAETVIPGLSDSIIVKETATPVTLQRYTFNTAGASYGWSSSLHQVDMNTMPAATSIQGLYLAGHWVTQGTGQGGISTVAYCGRTVAKSLIKRITC